MRRVVLAFDSLKGSLDAVDACSAAAAALRAAFEDLEVLERPMADGGEGSIDLIERLRGGERVQVATTDALGRPITAEYLLADGEACIEVAAACGLPQVQDVPLQPLAASTAGVGALVRDALERGAHAVTLFLGGSATTDGGVGVLEALGVRLVGATAATGGGLSTLTALDVSAVDPRALAATWTFVTDVDAPLTGPRGAAAVFGPQKGADAEQVAVLDAGLTRLADAAAEALGVDRDTIDQAPGAGAAGGFAAVLQPLTGGSIVAGSGWFAALVALDEALVGADLVITGEGRFDAQSLGGKVFSEVHAAAQRAGARTAVVAGSVDPALDAPVAAFSIATGPADLATLQRDAGRLLPRAVVHAVRLALG